jgi:hypothetical protein
MSKVELKIEVSRKHIEDAMPGDARHCAIARAMLDADTDIVWANVTTRWVQWGRASTELRYKYRTPAPAATFIREFDEGYTPKPLTVVLTSDDFVSITPRAMHQREKRSDVTERVYAAKVLAKPAQEISADDVKALREELAAQGKDIPLPRPRTRSTVTPSGRKYAKRATTADIYQLGK